MEFKDLLLEEKRTLLVKANGGISLPAAGCIYWGILAIAGFYLKPMTWFALAGFTSGMIFPMGLLLSKPLKSSLKSLSPLSGLILPALVSMMMFWPLAIAGALENPQFAPLALAVGMGIHWPVIGWMYGGKVFILHGLIRAFGASACWFLFPDHRFTLIPIFVALVYFLTLFGIVREVRAARVAVNA